MHEQGTIMYRLLHVIIPKLCVQYLSLRVYGFRKKKGNRRTDGRTKLIVILEDKKPSKSFSLYISTLSTFELAGTRLLPSYWEVTHTE